MWFCCNRATGMVMCQRLLSWRRRASSKWNYSTFAKGQRGRWEDDWTWLKHQTLPQMDDARIALSKHVCLFFDFDMFWLHFPTCYWLQTGDCFLFKLWYSKNCGQIMSNCQNRWWFQIFLILTPTWGKDPIWLRSFKLLNFCIRNVCWLMICQKSQTTTKDDYYPMIYPMVKVHGTVPKR